MHAIIGKKQTQSQKFLTDGTRIPVTLVEVRDNPVFMVKTQARDGYIAVQLGYGSKKHANKALLGHSKKGANVDYAPYFLAEVRFSNDAKTDELPKTGDTIAVSSVLEPGDVIDVTGISKGKGFAGGVKRYHFKGGPRTHGQSDRERAPGSIGQTTTPGRVYKGKRMAGKMGNDTVTLKNLEVVEVQQNSLVIKGLVPGISGSYLFIKKVGKNKKFVPLIQDVTNVNEPKEANIQEKSTEALIEKKEVKLEKTTQAASEVIKEQKRIEEEKK